MANARPDGPIRIAHLTESLGIGGAERRLVSDLRWLDRERYDHRVIYLTADDALRAEIDALGIPTEALGLSHLRQWPQAIARLAARLRAWRPQVVHTQVFGADVYGRIAAALTGVPLVLSTIQTMPYAPSLGRFYSRKRKLADRWTARWRTDHFIAVSETVRQGLIDTFGIPPSRLSTIQNGVDTDRFAPRPDERISAREALGVAADEPLVLHVGRLIPEKNQETLLRAFARLRARAPKARLLIAGDGPCRAQLEAVIRELGLERQATLLGTRHDVEQLYGAADCFILPSLREGSPVALVEAMASEVPVVVSSIPPHREIVEPGRTGWLAPPDDVAGLAEAIASVLEHPEEARRIAAAARAHALERFSAEAFARQLQALYDRLCRQRGWLAEPPPAFQPVAAGAAR